MKRLLVLAMMTMAAGPALADGPGEGWHGHMMYGDGYGYGVWGFGMMFLFWAAIIVAAVLAWRAVGQGGGAAKADSALEVLRTRLAKGEIDPEEFEARRKVLEG